MLYTAQMENNRQAFVKFALQYAGSASTGKRANEYLDLLTRRFETDQMRQDMVKMSSCALFIRSLWWCFGTEHELYDKPYKISNAPVDVLTIAKGKGAYHSGTILSPVHCPKAGDAFYIATKDGKREHFGLITKPLSIQPSLWKYETIEGGQGPGGRAIEKLTRSVIKTGSPHGTMGDRLLIGWVDFDTLALPGLRTGWENKKG